MATTSHDTKFEDLLKDISVGRYQLPDFQRSWVWDDTRICKLLESLFSNYPMGAVMNLAYGGNDVHFKYRLFTGVDKAYAEIKPEGLILDGQQRLTTLFQALYSQKPVRTCMPTKRDVEIKRFYYLDMRKCIDNDTDVLDAIISIPEDKKIKENIGRNVTLDLSTQECAPSWLPSR